MNVRASLQRHPVATYFSLAFLISSGGFVVVDGPRLVRGEAIRSIDALLLFPALVVGVGLLGIILTAVVDGRNGLRDLFARLRRWRVGVGWYAAALLIPPALILAVLFGLSVLVSPKFAPGFFPLGIVFGLVPGFFEEIGWMGFAFPKMRSTKRSVLATGVILGVLWGLWHAPVVDYLGAAAPHGAYWLPFFLSFIALMTAMRVLIVWIYSNTQSVLLAQLMHVSSTGCLVVFSATHASPAQETLWYATYAVVLWVVVALVVVIYGKGLVRLRPLRSVALARSA
jgi:membrane protease YdiL (CAAX protease family)